MSKAALIIEMPEKCAECPCQNFHTDYRCYVCEAGSRNAVKIWRSVDLNSKPDWCPLIPLPKTQEETPSDNVFERGEKKGWNAYRDAICGGKKE